MASPVLNLEHVQRHAVVGRGQARAHHVGARHRQRRRQIGEQARPVARRHSHAGGGFQRPFGGQGLDRRPFAPRPLDQGRMVGQGVFARHGVAPKQGLGRLEQGAHQLPLPAVPHARPHGADIGHGQHHQHAQALGIPHRLGEGAHGRGIGHVALLGVVAHQQVMAHQPDDQLDPARIDPQPLAGPARGDGAVLQLAPVAALAYVVQQHGQHQGLDIDDARHDGGRGRMVRLQLAARDVVDDPDRLKRVLVHRIGVVHVELGLADDPPPFRHEASQQPRLVHDRQDAIGPLAMRQHRQEGFGRARVAPQGGRHQRQRTDHGGEGVGVQVQIQPIRLDEQQQQPRRIACEDVGARHR